MLVNDPNEDITPQCLQTSSRVTLASSGAMAFSAVGLATSTPDSRRKEKLQSSSGREGGAFARACSGQR